MADNTQYYCKRCNRTMDATNFYMSNNLEKYPDNGKMSLCKKCMTAHVDNWNPDTFLWILQEADVPYIPDEWHALMMKYAKDKSKVTGTTIIGRYFSKMKLKQWKDYRWKDNEFIQEMMNHKIEETMKRQGYDVQDITTAVDRATYELPTGELREPAPPVPESQAPAENEPDYFDAINGFNEEDLVGDLTDDDKIYLRLKWGKTYKTSEWIELEKMYEDMKASYEINTAGHEDTLKLLCKTSLKAHQLLDLGDIEAAQKMIKVYDTLMKSGKFSAAQNKSENAEYINSISELVLMCEKDGFIPRYYIEQPNDKVDLMIKDMQDYTRNLITEEMHMGQLIERAVQNIEADRLREIELEMDDETEEEAFERELFGDSNRITSDQDFSDFEDFEEEQRRIDEELFKAFRAGEV